VVGSLPRTVARQDSLLYIAGTDEARVNGYFLSSALRRATWRSGYATVCKAARTHPASSLLFPVAFSSQRFDGGCASLRPRRYSLFPCRPVPIRVPIFPRASRVAMDAGNGVRGAPWQSQSRRRIRSRRDRSRASEESLHGAGLALDAGDGVNPKFGNFDIGISLPPCPESAHSARRQVAAAGFEPATSPPPMSHGYNRTIG
jgi:hypothetical protein